MAFTDAFTDTNGTALTSHNSPNWVLPSGATAPKISSNTVVGNLATNALSGCYYNATFADSHYSETIIPVGFNDEGGGPAVRMQSGSDHWYFCIQYAGDARIYVGEWNAGTFTDWEPAGIAGYVQGTTLRLEIDPSVSTTFRVYFDGSVVGTYTGKNSLSGGRAGVNCLGAGGNTVGVTSWEGGDTPGGAPPGATLGGSALTPGSGTAVPSFAITL